MHRFILPLHAPATVPIVVSRTVYPGVVPPPITASTSPVM
jgi:hypothetical protein